MERKAMSDIYPFRMYGNLYFIGSTRVSVHLIETECGLIMIDSGWPDMGEQIIDSMKILGFDPKDICAIFHTHGHLDHYANTNLFKELSGATTYISRIDQDTVNNYDLGPCKTFFKKEWQHWDLPESMHFDVLMEDGDEFTFGKTHIQWFLTPGHAPGVMSFFVNVEDGDESIIAAMHGGVGMSGMWSDRLELYGQTVEVREVFRQGLHRLKKMPADLVLGNHPEQSGTVEKMKRLMAGESIVNSTEWQSFLEAVEEELDEMIADGGHYQRRF